jgi:glycosyltransferase involved in cell wall biosynthesis
MRIHGILVTYRRPAELHLSLERLAGQRRPLDSLVVVDNAAGGEAAAIVGTHAQALPAEYVPAPDNLGPAGGIALGMDRVAASAADDDWVLTLDDDDPLTDADVVADLEAFAIRMLERDVRTAQVGLVGARFDRRRGRLARVRSGEMAGPVLVDYIGGNHCPFIRVGPLREVGPFRSELFFGLDDLDFGLRLRRAGYRTYVDGDRWRVRRATRRGLDRDVEPSLELGLASWRRYYSLRNAIDILRSNGEHATAARVMLVSGIAKPVANLTREPRAALAHLRLNWRACRDGWTGRLGRTIDPDGAGR